jgi:hypothetical protein
LILPTTEKVNKIGACGASVAAVVGDKVMFYQCRFSLDLILFKKFLMLQYHKM